MRHPDETQTGPERSTQNQHGTNLVLSPAIEGGHLPQKKSKDFPCSPVRWFGSMLKESCMAEAEEELDGESKNSVPAAPETLVCGIARWIIIIIKTTADGYEENSKAACGIDPDGAFVCHGHHFHSRVAVSRRHYESIRKSGEISQRILRRPRAPMIYHRPRFCTPTCHPARQPRRDCG